MQLWDTKTGKRVMSFTGDKFALSQDGEKLASGITNQNQPSTIHVLDTKNRRTEVYTLPQTVQMIFNHLPFLLMEKTLVSNGKRETYT